MVSNTYVVYFLLKHREIIIFRFEITEIFEKLLWSCLNLPFVFAFRLSDVGYAYSIAYRPGRQLSPFVFGNIRMIPHMLNIPRIEMLHSIGNFPIGKRIKIRHIIDMLPLNIILCFLLPLTRIHPKFTIHNQTEHTETDLSQILRVEAGPNVVADARFDVIQSHPASRNLSVLVDYLFKLE